MGLHSRMQPCTYDLFMLEKNIWPYEEKQTSWRVSDYWREFQSNVVIDIKYERIFSGAFIRLYQSSSTDWIYAARA